MVTRDATTGFARTVVDEWARAGVEHAVVAPGSRSTPLALALAADPRVSVHVLVDERSAGGFALGLARGSRRPVIVVCTSGTAAALLHGAVLEAHHGRVPLVVCTADRPPELHDVGAGQTIEQRGLYGRALRWEHDPGAPEDRPGAGVVWRQLAARAVSAAAGPPAGAVHLNLPFREPLVPTGAPVVEAPGRPDGAPWVRSRSGCRVPDAATVRAVIELVRAHPRGAVVAGWGADVPPELAERFALAAGWPVLADPLSGLRAGRAAISTYDAVARSAMAGVGAAERLRPDAVLRLGAPPTSKALGSWLAGVPTFLVDPDDRWLDPDRAAAERAACDAEPLLRQALAGLDAPADEWLRSWQLAERRARDALDAACDASDDVFEGRVARDVVAVLPAGAALVVASSMPVRDVESFAAPRAGIDVYANRGANGIDGFVSMSLGIAAARGGRTVSLLGDLCFLHDSNALIGVGGRGLDAVFVVVDNDGGGIFSFLPQASAAVSAEDFELLFGTPTGVDLAALAAVHDVPCCTVTRAPDVAPAVTAALDAGGVRMVHMRTSRTENVTQHRAVQAAVEDALR
jgi:2-succinyl-5-enolpyruvyl-6-hydroxy-3-cyclohexene-1-carboxylate synthase